MITSDYRLPGEFEGHKATWLLWPSRPDNWREKGYFAQNQTLALAAFISHFEPVRLGAPSTDVCSLQRQLPPAVKVVGMEFNDVWVRDTGPMVLVSAHRPPIALDWKFNSWGGLFSEAAADDRVAAAISHHENLQVIKAPIVLEGGAIISDGRGTIITTEESVLADNRNPGLTRREAEEIFRHFLNARTVIWLPYGLNHDEAGGHVDNVCSFASETLLLVASTSDSTHPSFERLRLTKDILSKARNASDKTLSLVEIPLPEPMFITAFESAGFEAPKGSIVRTAGSPLAPSHINFYATEQAIIVPTFNTPSDRIAVDIIGSIFASRLVVPYDSREFLLGGGAIHCLTKEIPQ